MSSLRCVLVVEDEAVIRFLLCESLRDFGFTVLEAECADDGLRVFAQHPEINVLITDVQTPGHIDGLELARWVHRQRPNTFIVVNSGRMLPGAAAVPNGTRLLAKPYGASDLALLAKEVNAHLAGQNR